MGSVMQLDDRIERRMKLQDLHVLMTVAQAGSMGKAADLLNTSQPNISRAISELEHALGVRLLDRHRQGVEPGACDRGVARGPRRPPLPGTSAALWDSYWPRCLGSNLRAAGCAPIAS